MKPAVSVHDGIEVVRDDLFPGGTKARFIPALYDGVDELVYASPAEGGAQTAIATVAAAIGKRASIFIARRKTPHPRAIMAKRLGARVFLVDPGYLSTVQARAREYASKARGAQLCPFGLDTPEAIAAIAAAARQIEEPDEVWCAAGSGVLSRGLAAAWPNARRHVVQVGRPIAPDDVAGATIHVAPLPFAQAIAAVPPFPSDPHYDAKAWAICKEKRARKGRVLFWNVTGPAD